MADADVIVIGGGAAALLDFAILEERIPEFSVNPRAAEVGIVLARYGADSGVAGGAALCA